MKDLSDLPQVASALQAMAPGCKIEVRVTQGPVRTDMAGMFGPHTPAEGKSDDDLAAERERQAADLRADVAKGDRP